MYFEQTPSPSSPNLLTPTESTILSEIEALEPGALLSLVSFRNHGIVSTDWSDNGLSASSLQSLSLPPLPMLTLPLAGWPDTSSSLPNPSLPPLPPLTPLPSLPPKKRIRRKYIIQVAEEEPKPTDYDVAADYHHEEEETTVPPTTLYAAGDEDHINPTHNILRRDILEVIVETPPSEPRGIRGKKNKMKKRSNDDIKSIKSIKSRFAGKIGLRCRFCKHLPEKARTSLATVYPETLNGIYRACSVRFQKRHLSGCQYVPDSIRRELESVKEQTARGSKSYWVESALRKGLRNSEDNKGIIYCPEIRG